MTVEWTPKRIEKLKKLWAEGLPAGEIGRQLGVTKNAVVGKVHRLGLPKRPSPIKSGAAKSSTPAAKKPKPKQKPKLIELDSLTAGMCCWPIGDPGMPGFHFCGAKVVPGKPYCEEHCARAYVRSGKGSSSSSAMSSSSSSSSSSSGAKNEAA